LRPSIRIPSASLRALIARIQPGDNVNLIFDFDSTERVAAIEESKFFATRLS
jgi:hypothetical protein